jgi:hypothetical protein
LRERVKQFRDFSKLKDLSGLSLQTIKLFASGKTYFIRAKTAWLLQDALSKAATESFVQRKPRSDGWQISESKWRPRQRRGKSPIRRSVQRVAAKR